MVSNDVNYIAEFNAEVKSLAAVILRRNISSTATDSQDITDNTNLWSRLSPDAKEFVKSELLKTITECNEKAIIHKICNLIIEVGGTLYEQEEFIW